MRKRIYTISFATMFAFALSVSVTVQARSSPVLNSARLMLFSHTAATTTTIAPDTDRDRDGLAGPVRRIRTETTRLASKGGKPVEGPRVVLETAAYDIKGKKIENAYFPVAGAATLTGREVYKYDDKGNISEMTLLNADGSLLSREVYTYEYDFVGNWTKMTTAVAVIEGGKLSFEPTEITYRTISYYLDENLTRMMQTAAASGSAPVVTPGNTVAQPAAGATSAAGQTNQPTQTATAIPPANGAATMNKNAFTGTANASPAPGGVTSAPVVMETEPPAKPAPKPLLKPVSGGVLNGSALSLPAPDYPETARRMRTVGTVVVEVLIDTEGKVISAKALSGNSMLQQAAVKAAYRARFSPTTLSGQPVKVSGVINYNFSLGK